MDWLVTTTTLFCDIVDYWVSIMVYPDGTIKCNHFGKHGPIKRVVKRKKILECTGPNCALCTDYREYVLQQDTEAAETDKVPV